MLENQNSDRGRHLKTSDNLKKSFSAESMASVRYSVFAYAAEKDGYRQIAKLFRAMSESEKIHAINTLRIIGEYGNTSENISSAIDAKTYDFNQWYPSLAEQADLEGKPIASTTFRGVSNAARAQVALLNNALENLGRNRDTDHWVCNACGHIVEGDMPVSCKICGASREKFFEIK